MTFMRKFHTILQKSNNNICRIDSEDGITLSNYDNNFNLISQKKLLEGTFSFLDYWFDISENDRIYGIVNDKNGLLYSFNFKNNYVIKNKLLKYNSESTFIKFVYIKNIRDCTHVIYCSIDISTPSNGILVHHYKKGSAWYTTTIDKISYNVLTNFVVTYDDTDMPTVFYYNLINGYEEVFASTFIEETGLWSTPIQITNSKKSKIYLSVIRDFKDLYHIVFSENNNSKYYCTYINGKIHDNNFYSINSSVLGDSVACTFPNVIEFNNFIFVNWIEYHTLYKISSNNDGKTWNAVNILNDSFNTPFVCCCYHTNIKFTSSFNYFTLYMNENSIDILGIN